MDFDVKELLLEIADNQGAIRDTKAGQGMYSCVHCASGQHGIGSTGAMHIYRNSKGTLVYKCFSCGKGGTAIDMYAETHNMPHDSHDRISIAKVIDAIKQEFGLSTNEDYNQFKSSYQYHSKIDEVTQEDIKPKKDYTKFYNYVLSKQYEAVKYLQSRGIQNAKELAQGFQIGYTDSYKYNGGTAETPAIIIPLSDWSYFWRSTQNSERRHQGSKYILNYKILSQDVKYCFIVESAIDCLSCLDLGFNAIGLNATSMIDKLFREYELNRDTVYIWALDNDKGGLDNVPKAEKLSREYKVPYIIADSNYLFSGAKDTNEALQKDRNTLLEHLEHYRNEALNLDKEKQLQEQSNTIVCQDITSTKEPEITAENITTQEVLEYMLRLNDETDIVLYAQKILNKAREFRLPVTEIKEIVTAFKRKALSKLKTDSISTGYPEYIKVGDNGKPYQTIENCLNVLQNDEMYKGRITFNEFSNKVLLDKKQWKDEDFSQLVYHMETNYNITNEKKIRHALAIENKRNKFHPIKNYLNSLKWDGVSRLSTLFTDFLGADDNKYTRAVSTVTLCGAVARVLNPGVKFDTMPVLVGKQGVGKSTIWAKLGGEWFSDTLDTIKGKEAYESIQNSWIIEIAELSAMAHATKEDTKKFITKTSDKYRKPYAENVEDIPRQCIFVGTTNDYEFLKDETGNRRFYPIDVDVQKATKSIWNDLTPEYINQLWAEAKELYLKHGENAIYIKNEEILKLADKQQTEHFEKSTTYLEVENYINMPVPPNWNDFNIEKRHEFIENYKQNGSSVYATEIRKNICIREILIDLYPKTYTIDDKIPKKDSNEMAKILISLGLKRSGSARFKLFGKQMIFSKQS